MLYRFWIQNFPDQVQIFNFILCIELQLQVVALVLCPFVLCLFDLMSFATLLQF